MKRTVQIPLFSATPLALFVQPIKWAVKRLTALLLLLVTSCSAYPGYSELREQVTPLLVPAELKDAIEVQNLHKTNGYQVNVNHYTVDVAYNLVFKASCQDLVNQTQPEANAAMRGSTESFDQLLNRAGGALATLGNMALLLEYGDCKAGDSFGRQARYTFIKTERGWKLSN